MTQVDEGPDSPGTPGVLIFGAPTLGEILAERYELQEHIGDDNFGRQIWRGIDVVLRRPVAVVLRYPGGDAAVEMLDAAVAASRVTHPHLVDVYDAIDEGTRAYVVREWVDGGSLREYVAEAPLEPERACTVAHAVASAVAAVHASGVSHGNIHPGTVLIGSDGRVVLSDARSAESITPDGDVRAIGAVLYCALTGHWPHAEAGPTSVPDAVRDPSGTIVPPRQMRGGVPGQLSDLATDLLDPELPAPSADVLTADLARLDTDGDEQFFSGGPLDFNQDPFRTAVAVPEPPRPVAKKLAIGVACLLVLAVVGLLLATQFLPKGSGSASTSPSAPAAPTSPGAAVNNGRPKLLPIPTSAARIIDPPKGDRTELRNAGYAVDGNQNTAWMTQHYNQPDFGNRKPGMGILVNLGSPQSVSNVQVTFTTPGAMVQLYAGKTDPGADGATSQTDEETYKTYTAIGAAPTEAKSTSVLTVPDDLGKVQYLMLWITKLPPAADGRYQVGVSEIQVYVNP
ncbi:MAG TPA: protein kinase family protein [Rugosimonospora sp.]|nr:protein kinase family protein [Rugosimonospora sp.]